MFLETLQKYPFIVALILGIIPAIIWLWFWLKEDIHPEPAKILTLAFFGGVLSVIFVLPFQKLVFDYLREDLFWSFTLYAAIEEISKFGFVYYIALRKKIIDEPVDDMIYMIVSAIGFSTFENILFLTEIFKDGDFLNTIINGNMRFIGASLIHIMSSATIGTMLGLAFYKTRKEKMVYASIGIIIATVLHTRFNLFIISGAPGNIFLVFGGVWLCIVVLLLLFEKIKHLRNENLKNYER